MKAPRPPSASAYVFAALRYRLWLCLLAGFALVGNLSCDEDDDSLASEPEPEPVAGAIFVKVRLDGGPGARAVIATDPVTTSVTTDATGTVLLKDVPAGIYEVTATIEGVGYGKTAVRVAEGDVVDAPIEIARGVFPSLNVVIDSPPSGTQSTQNEGVTLLVRTFASNVANPDALRLEVLSSLDGSLAKDIRLQPFGNQVQLTSLSVGVHTLTARVTGADGLSKEATVTHTVTPPIVQAVLRQPTVDSQNVVLSWSPTNAPDFVRYSLFRYEGTEAFRAEQIRQTSNPNDTTFTDVGTQVFRNYTYYLITETRNNFGIESNRVTIERTGESIALDGSITKMLFDARRSLIYGVDRVNNKLHIIDPATKTVVKSFFVGSAPVDMAMSRDGKEMYIANVGSTEIAVVDLDGQKVARTFFVDPNVGTWDGNPSEIAVLNDDQIVYTSFDQWNSLKVVNARTGVLIANGGSIYSPSIEVPPDGKSIYVGESGSSGSKLIRFEVKGDRVEEVDVSDGTSYPSGPLVLTADGKYLFKGSRKVLAANLKSVIGTFTESIFAASASGDVAVGETKVFDGTNFAIKRLLPVSSKIAVLTDDQVLYQFDAVSSRVVVTRL